MPVPLEHQPSGAPRALIVDDEPAVRSVLSRMLRRHGWEADVAEGGASALALIASIGERPAPWRLVICDLRMPEHSGEEVVAWIRTHRPDLCGRVVLASGDVHDPTVAGFLASCGCAVLEKPFTLPELQRVIALVTEAPSRAA